MSIVLDATTLKLTVALSGAVTTNELPIVASYADRTATEITPGSVDTQTNGATAVDAVPAPAASTQRLVKSLSIHNADTVDATVTVALDNDGTARTLVTVTLSTGESLEYADGWKALDAAGNQKLVIQNTSLHALGGALHSAATLAELNALVSDATLDDSGDPRTDSAAVHAADFDANTILKADADDTPTALAVAEGRVVGRLAGGVITDLTATESRTLLNVEDGATAGDDDAIHASASGEIAAITEKVTPVSADLLLIEDSEATNAKKSVQIGSLPSSGGASQLSDLSDVGVTTPTSGNALVADGDSWESTPLGNLAVLKTLFDAHTILAANADDTPAAVPVAEGRMMGRLAGGNITDLTVAQVKALLGLDSGEIFLTAAGGWPSTTGGCAPNVLTEYGTNDVDMYSLDFDPDTDEYAQWSVWMPDDWDGGTVTAKFVWTAASSTGDVIWGLQGRSYADDDAIDQAWGTPQTVTDTLLATGDVHYSGATSAITLAGTPAAGELVQIRAYRDADAGGDTLAADARLLGIKIYYGRS